MEDLFARIMDAHETIRPQVSITPLDHSAALSALLGCDVLLKGEHFQPTGSFKIRGATNKVRVLSRQARRAGVVTASTGNHGLAVARAGALAGVPVTVYLPANTARPKIDGIRALGAELVVLDAPSIEAENQARRAAAEQGKTYISPYNDIDVMAGQGTLGVELADQDRDLDAVFIAVGGGGLIGGAGTALKALRPETRVVGVWPENSACMLGALKAGKIIDVEERETLSDGTSGAIEPGSITFPVCQAVIDERVVVTETEIAAGMRAVADAEHWIVEGSAGAAMAGLIQQAQAYKGGRVAVVLCGRNVALETFLKAVGPA